MHHKISQGAIFIADCHENKQREWFWKFLCDIKANKITPSELFLMGDIFDLLVGEITFTHSFAKKYINLLDELAKKIPIFYFEGNHDFNLQKIFSHVKVIPLQNQPMIFKYKNQKILLSHGDIYGDLSYILYTKFIRHSFTCKVLNTLNNALNGYISNKILHAQKSKNICKKIKNFKQNINVKLQKYPLKNIDVVCEGHYHQNENFTCKGVMYQNFSSFACDKSYFVVQSHKSIKFTQIKLRGNNGINI